MREYKLHFLDKQMAETLLNKTKGFETSSESPEEFMKSIKELLPLHKTDQDTWKTRLEGLFEISELLFDATLAKGKEKEGETWDRQNIVVEAQLRPFSYYHWLTGSREPASNVLTRDDYLNDPTTALVKLEDDIKSLCVLFRRLDNR